MGNLHYHCGWAHQIQSYVTLTSDTSGPATPVKWTVLGCYAKDYESQSLLELLKFFEVSEGKVFGKCNQIQGAIISLFIKVWHSTNPEKASDPAQNKTKEIDS